MRGRGFSSKQIIRAMRQASPAMYLQSEKVAQRYARKFNNYAKEFEKKQRQKQIEIEKQKQAKKYRRSPRI